MTNEKSSEANNMIAGFKFEKPLNNSGWGRCLVWGWVVVLLLVPVHGTLSVWLGSNFGSYLLWRSWKEALILALLSAALIWLTQNDPKTLRRLAGRRVNQLIAAYVLLHLLLSINGPNLEAVLFGLVYNLRFLGFFLLAQVIGHYFQMKNEKRKMANEDHLIKLVLYPAAVVIGFGLLQMFVLPPDWLRHLGYNADTIVPFNTIDGEDEWVRISSFTRGTLQLGQYLILPLILMGALWLVRKSRLLLAGMLAGFVVIIGTYSRSAWLGLAIAAVSYTSISVDWQKHGRKILLAVGVGLTLLVGIIGVAPNSERLRVIVFHDQTDSDGRRDPNELRLIHTTWAVKDIVANPFGGGPGSAGPASFHNDERVRINDNYYLQLALEVGMAGLIVFLWISWLTVKHFWLHRAEFWPRVLLSVSIGMALINLVLPAWANEETALIWWGLAGLFYVEKY